jgi:hypothetical protein
MACNCKHSREDVERGTKEFEKLRELFIKRMTEDSETKDRRRRDYNQAIFIVEADEEIDAWNKDCSKYGLAPKKYGATLPVWADMDMSMVLKCFDDAVKDWRKTFCDVEGCRRKWQKRIARTQFP